MNWASLQYAERQNLWQNWTSVPRLQVMMNKFILEEHAVLTCISANDNWSLVIFFFCRPDMEEAKEVHKCLKIAAGVFTYVKVSLKVGHQSSSRLHYDKWKLLEQCTLRH